MTQEERGKAIGGGVRPTYEDDSIRTWPCGCYEDQGGYHFCAKHPTPVAAGSTPEAGT